VTPKRIQKNPKKVTKDKDIKEKSGFSQVQNRPSFKGQTCSPCSQTQNLMAQLTKWRLKTPRTPWKSLNPILSHLTWLGMAFVLVWTVRTEPILTPISLYPDHIFAWNSHRKGRIWCREETVHGGFAKFYTLSQPNWPWTLAEVNPHVFDVGWHSGARPEHARTWTPTRPRPARAHTHATAIKPTLVHDHLPRCLLCTTPNSPELARSFGDLPATHQSRPRATIVAKPFPTHLRSIQALG
jgi:hypothetical protein